MGGTVVRPKALDAKDFQRRSRFSRAAFAVQVQPNTATHCMPSKICLPSAFHRRSRSDE